jgi:septal ring factor EnvC (AmiA/AmiB activator)
MSAKVIRPVKTFKPVLWLALSLLLPGCGVTTPETFFDWGVIDRPVKQEKHHEVRSPPPPGTNGTVRNPTFIWPAKGAVVRAFTLHQPDENAGIDIRLAAGTDIRASAPGKVVYVGDALKSYGTLIIVSHPDGYATVYARALTSSVRKGDVLQVGQLLGHSTEQFDGLLHFELRQGNKPLDPIPYLQKR